VRKVKYLTFILLMISCGLCKGQGVKFKFYLTKVCGNIEELDTSYYLSPVNQLDTSFFPKAGITYLPKTGRYLIGFNRGPLLDSSIVDIRDTGLYILRYKEPEIQLFITGATDRPPIYVNCEHPINGYQEAVYPNGNLKMRGNFVNGYQKDSLVTFYPTGGVQKRIIVLRKIINIKEYDSLGNLIKVSHNQKKSFMTYWEYEWITYFPDGKIKSTESSIKRVIRIKEFYPSGQVKVTQTKKSRIEYYENGVKAITYNWKHKRKKFGGQHSKDFTVWTVKYDEKGQILQSAVYEEWNYSDPQPQLDISRADWIRSIQKYKDGNKIFAIQDIDIKEYLKAYPND
jgi:antitoxin component YwqK of YwqJK toxin-antitoxin module